MKNSGLNNVLEYLRRIVSYFCFPLLIQNVRFEKAKLPVQSCKGLENIVCSTESGETSDLFRIMLINTTIAHISYTGSSSLNIRLWCFCATLICQKSDQDQIFGLHVNLVIYDVILAANLYKLFTILLCYDLYVKPRWTFCVYCNVSGDITSSQNI